MENAPHLDCIKPRLDRALPHFLAVPGVSQQVVGGRRSGAQSERVFKNLLAGNDESFIRATGLPRCAGLGRDSLGSRTPNAAPGGHRHDLGRGASW